MTSPYKNKTFFPNWEILRRLRECFLGETFTKSSYWESEEVLLQYDFTFGQRILWKWLSVFDASKEVIKWDGKFNLLDWGCGTGIASRSFLQSLGSEKINSLFLFDKSQKAISFAINRITSQFPDVNISSWNEKPDRNLFSSPLILLVSHILNELSEADKNQLLSLMKKSQAIIWVEPGTPQNSESLIEWREKLRSEFIFALPCTHQKICGLFQSEFTNWCHFFATPPAFVFQDPFWREFSKKMGIDLRSLPVSYWVGISKSLKTSLNTSLSPGKRLLGRARHYKGYSLALNCDESGVREEKLLQREKKEVIDILKENPFHFNFIAPSHK